MPGLIRFNRLFLIDKIIDAVERAAERIVMKILGEVDACR